MGGILGRAPKPPSPPPPPPAPLAEPEEEERRRRLAAIARRRRGRHGTIATSARGVLAARDPNAALGAKNLLGE